jgi:hypothetical protein
MPSFLHVIPTPLVIDDKRTGQGEYSVANGRKEAATGAD